jgi:hypothetical protein
VEEQKIRDSSAAQPSPQNDKSCDNWRRTISAWCRGHEALFVILSEAKNPGSLAGVSIGS